jgi:hypothetical protein
VEAAIIGLSTSDEGGKRFQEDPRGAWIPTKGEENYEKFYVQVQILCKEF